ncbi:MAG: PLxRFG domain-containing protein, partial [Deltaproteobacteria bacterium]|nr:PLxRFG domain-containing protein [Deltaproteobacteria bacterium]
AMDNTALMRSVEKIQGLGLVEQHFDVYYGLQNDSEFLAEVFTSPHMQKYLKSLPAEEAVGHLTRRSLWDQFIDFLNHIFFGEKNHQNLLSQTLNLGAQIVEAEKIKWRRGKIVAAVPEMGGTQPILEVPHAALPENMQINLDGLTHDAFPGNVAGDSKFDPYLAKYRFLIHLTDPDLKKWQEIGVLPFWLAKEHAEFKPFLQTQERREEKRSELKTEWFKRKEGFTFLRGDNLSKTEEALIAGDAEGKVWTDSQLTERFNLSPEGITAYKAVRATLDGIFQENLARAEAAILDNARRTIDSAFDKLTSQIESHKASEQKDVILDLLRTAHDLPLSDEETTHLANLLGETQQATEKPLKTVKNKLVKIFNEILTEKDKAKLLTDFEGAYEKTQAQIGDIREIIHNALGGDVDRANLDQITKGLVHAYLRTERPATTLKELRAEFGKAKGYFPRDHGRGKYEIFVTQDTFDDLGQAQKRVLWNHFYDQIAGTRAYMQLKKDPEFNQPGMEIGIRLHKEEPDSSFWRASLANLQRLTDNSIEELKRKGTIPPEWAEGLRFQILYELSDQFKARGAARHFIHRADFLIGGYKTTGLNEVLNDYISGWSGMITKQDAAGEFLEAMKGIPADKPKLKNYAFQYTENQLRNDEQTDRVLGKLRGLVFTYFLGGSLRGALVNSTQSLTMTAPWLAREVGWKGLRAEKLVLSSAVDIATNRLSVVERRLLDDAHDKGATEAQYINSVISEGGDRFGKTTGKIIALLAKPFAFFETKNRQIAALSYFRAKFPDMIKTMTEEEVYQKLLPESIDFVNKTQFMMSKGNLPNWASGGDVGSQFFRTAYTFRKFNHNYLLSLRNSFRGPDGKVALDVIGRSLAYVVLLGGLPAIPFLDDLLDEWEKIFGQPVRREIKRNLSVIGGPALEKMGMMGIPAIVGIDISGSLKMGIPFVGGPSESVFGVWAGLGQKFMNAKDSAGKGEVLRAIESASPAFLESMLKAYRMTEQGATTATGKIIYDEKGQPIKETIGEGITQAFGFRPERISEASKTHREFANIESNFRNRMDDLYARFRLAKDAGERKKVILDIQKYNLEAIKYRGAVPMINVQNLRQSFISKPEKKYLLWGAQK